MAWRVMQIAAAAALLGLGASAQAIPRARPHRRVARASLHRGAAPKRRRPVAEPQRPSLAPAPAILADEPPPVLPIAPALSPAPRIDHRPRWGLVGSGITLFAAGYALDAGLSFGLEVGRPALSLIPLVGPLVQMGQSWAFVEPSATGNPQIDQQANQRIDAVNRATQTAAYVILAVDFVVQLAGVTMAIVGSLPRRPRPARSSPPSTSPAATPPGPALSWIGPDGRPGLTLTF